MDELNENENENIFVDTDTDTDITTDEDETDDDFETDITYEIFHLDAGFLDSEKTNGQYILGIYTFQQNHFTQQNEILFASGISPGTFFKYSYDDIKKYLMYYSIYFSFMDVSFPKIEIIQLQINNEGMYLAVLKTFWLRIIQRKWKKIYQQRKQLLNKRGLFKIQNHFQIWGKYPEGYNYFPNIHGMMMPVNSM